MDNNQYIVSARKYRPQNFDIVIGQNHITTTLKNAIINNQLAHAYLFCGPRGVGKTTCARILAKAINCENLNPNAEPCNQCKPCLSFQSGATFNIFELDAASNNSVDDIRNLIEQVRYAPQGGKYKVFIVDEVHMLSTGAFNAFLKTLEEPPNYAIFILATTEKYKILPTILSRCQMYDFKRININDITNCLNDIAQKENIKTENEALTIIAQKSDGGMRDALSMFDKIVSFTNGNITYQNTIEHLNVLDINYFFNLFELIKTQNVGQALILFEEVYKKGFEGDVFLSSLTEFLRDLLVCKTIESKILLNVLENFKNQYEVLSNSLSLSFILSAINILNEAEINFKTTRNKKLLIETSLIKILYLNNALDILENETELNIKKKTQYNQLVKTRPILYSNKLKKIIETQKINKVEKINISNNEIDNNLKNTTSTITNQNISFNTDDFIQNIINTTSYKNEQPIIKLTQENLKQYSYEFIKILIEQHKGNTAIIFQQSNFELSDTNDNLINIKINNEFSKKNIQQEEFNFLQYIIKKTNRKDYTFNIIIDETIKEEKIQHFSSNELFEKLYQQNPILLELKNKLNLDILF